VSLFADQLTKVTVTEIQAFADACTANKSPAGIKKAIVKGIPRQAVLKPSHTIYRLQNQRFALGDRVTMVQDSGGVPLSVKGVVIGLNAKSMDVVWDVPFMSGVTLGDRCSEYRGSTVDFNSCLNLTNPQFVASTNPKAPTATAPNSPFKPRAGPYPAVRPAPGQSPASGFRPAPASHVPVHIMSNPNRARGGFHPNRRDGPLHNRANIPSLMSGAEIDGEPSSAHTNSTNFSRGSIGGRGSFFPRARGRGFMTNFDRGRGVPHRGFRGRGRGVVAAPLPS